MNELQIFNSDIIPVYQTNEGVKIVIGRELHQSLSIKTPYDKWMPRMIEYGFDEQKDYSTFLSNRSDGKAGKPKHEHYLTLDMAKHIAMIQRTEKGKQIRQKLIELEEKVNTKDSYMIEDPIERAKCWIKEQEAFKSLETKAKIFEQQIAELQPKGSYYDLVLNCPDLLSISKIAKDYGKSAVWMNRKLHDLAVQYKQGDIWLLYQKHADKGYTSTKTQIYSGDDGQTHSKVHTYWTQKGRLFIYDLLKAEGILPLIEREEI